MFPPCNCGFDWKRNTINLKLGIIGFNAPDAMSIRCPVCGAEDPNKTTLSHLGVHRLPGGRVVQWEDFANQYIRVDDAETISLKEILLDGVLIFGDGSQNPQVGQLPVKADYLGLVDIERFRANPSWHGQINERLGRYQVRIPFHGQADDPELIELDLIGVGNRVTNQPRRDMLEGFELTLWPKVRAPQWHTFIIEARVHATAYATFEEDSLSESWSARYLDTSGKLIALEPIDFCGFKVSDSNPHPVEIRMKRLGALSTSGRPEVVTVNLSTADGLVYGGVFLIDPPAPIASGALTTTTIGLDFGTSNSCVAFDDITENQGILPITDLHEYLVRGHRPGAPFQMAEWAPRMPTKGFGPCGEFLPSQLLTRWTVETTRSHTPDAISEWRPGLDFAIGGDDVDWRGFDPSNALLRNLKWEDTARAEALRMAYLKTLLLINLANYFNHKEAQHVGAPNLPAALNLRFAHPGSWSTTAITQLQSTLLRATAPSRDGLHHWGVRDWVRLDVDVAHNPLNEAAAAVNIVTQANHDQALIGGRYTVQLLVDIGGGSTDISFLWRDQGGQSTTIVEYATSLKYAGEDLFEALLGPEGGAQIANRCLVRGFSGDEIRRKLRQNGMTSDLIDPIKQSMTKRRVEAFFDQLIEYIARLIASTWFNGQVQRRFGGFSTQVVHLARLGSGWGLADLVHPNPNQSFSFLLERRVMELLESIPEAKVNVEPLILPRGVHPKHVVAFGLLGQQRQTQIVYTSSQRMEQGRDPDWMSVAPSPCRSIVGLPTTMVCFDLPENQRTTLIDWWRPIEFDLNIHFPSIHGPSLESNAAYHWRLDDFEKAGIIFPDKIVGSKDNFLRVIQESQPKLQASRQQNQHWFSKSPLDLFIESGLRTRLLTLP
ncbi:hypothetical protein KJ940_17265 [Myxococcota bacterium]|nr:hypothetical protein [Myxococcota bacterium]